MMIVVIRGHIWRQRSKRFGARYLLSIYIIHVINIYITSKGDGDGIRNDKVYWIRCIPTLHFLTKLLVNTWYFLKYIWFSVSIIDEGHFLLTCVLGMMRVIFC